MGTATIQRRTAGAVFMLLVALLLAACGNDYDNAGYVRPAPVVNPTTGERCTAWVNNPHEADDTGLRACDYPIPQTPPVYQPGMSPADWALLGYMFHYGAGHSDFFFDPYGNYYNRYIGPAWSRYPGTYYGYGHAPVQRVGDVNVYKTTVVHNYDTRNASTITTSRSDPKYSGYTDTKTGKSYTGKNVPTKSFSGGPATYKSGGNATVSGSPGTKNTPPSSGRSSWSNSGSSSGKGGYSPSGGSRSGGGGGRK